MGSVLWLLQIVLALAFLPIGLLLVVRSRERLLGFAPWVEDYPEGVVKGVGVLALVCAAGLVVPAALGVATVVVPGAALVLAVLMLAAVVIDLLRGESGRATGPAVLLLAALAVALGRFGPWPL